MSESDEDRALVVTRALNEFLGERFSGESTIVIINVLLRLAVGYGARLNANPRKIVLKLHQWLDENALDVINKVRAVDEKPNG